MTTWAEHQEWERQWWGNCLNTFAEEAKQITYAHRMGLPMYQQPTRPGTWPCYNAGGKAILDIGGGPVSMLLKCVNFNYGTVIDPCKYPQWVYERYQLADIECLQQPGETPPPANTYDECWIYNCLQHTDAPELIVENARAAAPVIRIFEWIDREPCIGHPQTLRAAELDRWLNGKGTTENFTPSTPNHNGCIGPAYYGVFGDLTKTIKKHGDPRG